MKIIPDPGFCIVKGISMHPVLETGDRVILRPVERSQVQCGDILVFTCGNAKQIIHRVIRLSPLQTRGDNCVSDDPPVPENAILRQAVAFRRNTRTIPLSCGAAGVKEFRKNQRRRKIKHLLKDLLRPVAECNPFKIPFRKLNSAEFPGKTIYYAGKIPVIRRDKQGWHWIRWGRFFVEAPPGGNEDDRRN